MESCSDEPAFCCHVIEKEVGVVPVVDVEITPACLQSDVLFDFHTEETNDLIIRTRAASSGVAGDDDGHIPREKHEELGSSEGVDPVLRRGDWVVDSRAEGQLFSEMPVAQAHESIDFEIPFIDESVSAFGCEKELSGSEVDMVDASLVFGEPMVVAQPD